MRTLTGTRGSIMDDTNIGAMLIFYAMLALIICVGIWLGSYSLRSRHREMEAELDKLEETIDGLVGSVGDLCDEASSRLTSLEDAARAAESASRGRGVLIGEIVKSLSSLRAEMALHASTLVQVTREIGLTDDDAPHGDPDEVEVSEIEVEGEPSSDDDVVFSAEEIFAEGDDTPEESRIT